MLAHEGADEAAADQIVVALGRTGLHPEQMRAWLAHPQRAYKVRTGTMTIAGESFDTWSVPVHAIEDGLSDAVRAAAERFAAASEDERFVCLTFLCNLDELANSRMEMPTASQRCGASQRC